MNLAEQISKLIASEIIDIKTKLEEDGVSQEIIVRAFADIDKHLNYDGLYASKRIKRTGKARKKKEIVIVLNYSAKMHVLFGDVTKKTISKMNWLQYNSKLTFGCGWTLSKAHLDELRLILEESKAKWREAELTDFKKENLTFDNDFNEHDMTGKDITVEDLYNSGSESNYEDYDGYFNVSNIDKNYNCADNSSNSSSDEMSIKSKKPFSKEIKNVKSGNKEEAKSKKIIKKSNYDEERGEREDKKSLKKVNYNNSTPKKSTRNQIVPFRSQPVTTSVNNNNNNTETKRTIKVSKDGNTHTETTTTTTYNYDYGGNSGEYDDMNGGSGDVNGNGTLPYYIDSQGQVRLTPWIKAMINGSADYNNYGYGMPNGIYDMGNYDNDVSDMTSDSSGFSDMTSATSNDSSDNNVGHYGMTSSDDAGNYELANDDDDDINFGRPIILSATASDLENEYGALENYENSNEENNDEDYSYKKKEKKREREKGEREERKDAQEE